MVVERKTHIEIEPGKGAIGRLDAGDVFQITDLAGGQVFDVAFFDLADPWTHADLTCSCMAAGRWKLDVGQIIYTNKMEPLLEIAEDTCGVHEWTGGYCSIELNRYFGNNHVGCKEVLLSMLVNAGIDSNVLVSNSCFNPFMNMPFKEDGTWPVLAPVSVKNDRIAFKALKPVLWAGSVCTMEEPTNRWPLTNILCTIKDAPGSWM